MLKAKVKACIEKYQEQLISELEGNQSGNKGATDLDDYELGERMQRLEAARKDLVYLRAIPIAKSSRISEGSLIQTEDLNFYVGIVTPKFRDEGMDIVGISTRSPIYKDLEGEAICYTFLFNGRECTISSIE